MSKTFSPSEVVLLAHRLTIPDALAEVLADDENEVLAILGIRDNGRAVDVACTNLLALIERNTPVAQLVGEASELERWILTDVIEGSTYVACHSEEPPRVRAAAIRTAHSVVRKLRAAGLDVGDVPVY
jgi:hypothetical protein